MSTSPVDLSQFTDASGGGDVGGAGATIGPSSTSTDDSTVAQMADIFGTAGATALSVVAHAQGPTALAPGVTYVTAGGQVVTAPAANSLTAIAGSSSSLLLIVAAIVVVLILVMRKKG